MATQKRKQEDKDADVDEALIQWFTLATSQGLQVSGPILKALNQKTLQGNLEMTNSKPPVVGYLDGK